MMDTKAYLMSQGWSGPGSPLNPTTRRHESGRRPHRGLGQGLSKPILVSRKDNTFGVGKKTTHDLTNQWWLRGFEEALRGVGTDGSSTPTSTTGAESAAPTGEKDESELYKYFVRGQGLPGTFRRGSRGQEGTTPKRIKEEGDLEKTKKRKRDDEARSTKKGRYKKTRPADGAESMEIPTGDEDMNPDGKRAKKKNGKEKRRKRKSEEETKLPTEDFAEGAEDKANRRNKTSHLPITDDDERRRLKSLKKLAKKAQREEKTDRSNNKNKKTKSKRTR